MRKIKFLVILIAAFIACVACGSTGKSTAASTNPGVIIKSFSDAIGKDWKLIEARSDKEDIFFDRNTLSSEDARDIFTMKIDAETISGTGAPNRFAAPYSLGAGQSIEVKIMRTTLMAPLHEPEKLKEHEFFLFLQNASEWKIVNNNLEFYSKTEEGDAVVLVFSLQ